MNQQQHITTENRTETVAAQSSGDVSGVGRLSVGAAPTVGDVDASSESRLGRSIRFVVKGLPAVCFCQLL